MSGAPAPNTCPGCGERVPGGRPSARCDACLDAEAALDAHSRAKGLRVPASAPAPVPASTSPASTSPASTSHAVSEVVRLTGEVERLTSLLGIYGDHKVSCSQRHSFTYACTCGWREVRP